MAGGWYETLSVGETLGGSPTERRVRLSSEMGSLEVDVRNLAVLCAGIATAMMVSPPEVNATLARPYSLRELVFSADAITGGVIVDQETLWDGGELYTISWLAADRHWLGDESLIAIRQLGGVADGLERKVAGIGRLALGDHIIAFTRTDGAFHYLIGLGQGAYHLDPQGLSRRDLPELAAAQGPVAPRAPDGLQRSRFEAELVRLLNERSPR